MDSGEIKGGGGGGWLIIRVEWTKYFGLVGFDRTLKGDIGTSEFSDQSCLPSSPYPLANRSSVAHVLISRMCFI